MKYNRVILDLIANDPHVYERKFVIKPDAVIIKPPKGKRMSFTLETMRQRVREQITTSITQMKAANDQLDRAIKRIEGSVNSAHDAGLEEAALIAENIDSADGMRIAAVIRSRKKLPAAKGSPDALRG